MCLTGDYRIVFVAAYIETTLDILCEAVHRTNLKSSDYVWITMAWSAEWWETSSNASCSPEVMQGIANNSLLIIPDGYLIVDPSEQNYSSIVTLKEEELSLLDGSGNFSSTHFIFPPGVLFDAVLALALGLMEAADRVSRNDSSGCDSFPGELVPLEEFSYFNDRMGCVLHQSLANLSFVGVTGRVEFSENGSRLNDNHIALLQHRMVDDNIQAVTGKILRRLRVANIIVDQNGATFQYTDGENVSTVWPDGVPYDGSPVQEIDSHHLALAIIYAMLSSAGLVYAAICLAFNVIFRNRLVVKLSSPVINYLILVGAVLLYVTVFFLVLSSDDPAVETVYCNIELWLFSIGYTLCFAVFLAKTWRVYYIFTNPVARKKKVLIKDWVMFAIVGVVVGVQVIILVVGTSVPQIQPIANITDDEELPTSVNSEGENVESVFVTCALDSIPQRVWIVISLVYMGLLELVAMFMAFHTRKVRIKAINDSKEIAALVYINSIILIMIAIALLTLTDKHELFVTVLGLCFILASTIFLSLVFIPTAVRLYRDPDGEKALHTTTINNTSDKNVVTRSLSLSESPNRAMSFSYRPSVTKMYLPTLKEDEEEGKENLELSEKVAQVNSLNKEPNSEEKKSCGDEKSSTNSHHYKKTESQL